MVVAIVVVAALVAVDSVTVDDGVVEDAVVGADVGSAEAPPPEQAATANTKAMARIRRICVETLKRPCRFHLLGACRRSELSGQLDRCQRSLGYETAPWATSRFMVAQSEVGGSSAHSRSRAGCAGRPAVAR